MEGSRVTKEASRDTPQGSRGTLEGSRDALEGSKDTGCVQSQSSIVGWGSLNGPR